MKSGTPLVVSTAVALSGNLAKAVPLVLPEEDAAYWNRHLQELHEAVGGVLFRSRGNWLDRLVQAENDAYRAFFGRTTTFDLSQFRATLDSHGEERVGQWIQLGLEPHFLPKRQFQLGDKLRGWKVKPEEWFWQQVTAGNIKRRNVDGELVTVTEVGFAGEVVLIDTRQKPAYDNGQQMFDNDEEFLGSVIERLRVDGKIEDYSPRQSRFGVSSKEWDNQIRPALSAWPEFKDVIWRLESAIEANIIPQIYKQMPRRDDGKTDAWVWYEEFFEDASYRLHGGISVGGLAYVRYYVADDHWRYRAVRPLGVVATLPLGS